MKFMYFIAMAIFNWKKNINFIYNHLFCCNHTCYCVGMVSVMSLSRYVTSASRYQSRSSMYIQYLIPQNSTELAKAFSIDCYIWYQEGIYTVSTILKDFKNATLPSLYTFQKTIECRLLLLWWCHHELAAVTNILVLIVQLNLRTLLLQMNLVVKSISYVTEILSHRNTGYKQLNVKSAFNAFHRPVNHWKSDSEWFLNH